MSGRLSMRETITWGNLLEQETIEIASRAKSYFQKAQTKLSAGSGHAITGISGNDRALASLCICLTKLSELESLYNAPYPSTLLGLLSLLLSILFTSLSPSVGQHSHLRKNVTQKLVYNDNLEWPLVSSLTRSRLSP